MGFAFTHRDSAVFNLPRHFMSDVTAHQEEVIYTARPLAAIAHPFKPNEYLAPAIQTFEGGDSNRQTRNGTEDKAASARSLQKWNEMHATTAQLQYLHEYVLHREQALSTLSLNLAAAV